MKKILSVYKAVLSLSFWTGLILVSLFSTFSVGKKKKEKTNICFFELDNTVTSDNFQEKSDNTVGVHRYPTEKHIDFCKKKLKLTGDGFDERKKITACSFEQMIKSGKQCEGLTISSHHAGDWWGKKGVLMLKDLETLSCKKEYKGWFNNIKALWLDGCNTVTDNFIKSGGVIKTPDSETVRVVGKKKDKTKLNKRHIGAYQQSYAGSLDENTPFSSRYLRMFPDTQIYGFNGAAPEGEGQVYDQQSFIHDHLTKLGKALKAEKNKKKSEESGILFKRGLKALFSDDPCDEEKIKAWKGVSEQARFEAVEHQDYKTEYKLGCDLILAKQVLDNPQSTEAQKALAKKIVQNYKEAENILNDPTSTEDQKILAREMIKDKEKALNLANDILYKPTSKKAVELAKLSIIRTLKIINKEDQNVKEQDKQYSHLLFNNIYDTWLTAKRYKSKDSKFFNDVKSEFTTNSFTKTLEKRISSRYTASLRKGDYIKFYTEVHDEDIKKGGDKAKFAKEHIAGLLNKARKNFRQLKSPRQQKLDPETKRALAVSVVDQLSQYDLLSKSQIKQLVNNPNLFPKDTDNPFILDTQIRLKFMTDKGQIISTLTEKKEHSADRRRAIRTGAGIYLNQFNNDQLRQSSKNRLKELAEKIGLGYIKKDSDYYAFFQALDSQIRGRTDQEKEDMIYNLSKDTGENLESLVLSYAAANLEPKLKERLYQKMNDKSHFYRYKLRR